MAITNNIYIQGTDLVGVVDTAANANFIDVVGNKSDASSNAATASVIAKLKYIVANLSTDTDVTALIGALTDAAATGAVTNTDTVMAYIKQLVTDEIALAVLIGTPAVDVSADILAVKTVVDLIKGYTDTEVATLITEVAKIPKSDSNVTFNATALAAIEAEAEKALARANFKGGYYFVDLTSGNDANTGLSWSQALKTITAANALCTTLLGYQIYVTGSQTSTAATVLDKQNVHYIGVPSVDSLTGGNVSFSTVTAGISIFEVTAVKCSMNNFRISMSANSCTGIEFKTNVISQGKFKNINIFGTPTDNTGAGIKFTTVPSQCEFENIRIHGNAGGVNRLQHGIIGATSKCHFKNIYIGHTEGQGIYNVGSVNDVFENIVLMPDVATGLEIVATNSDSIVINPINLATIKYGGAHTATVSLGEYTSNLSHGAGAYPANVVDGSTFAFLASKVANGDISSFDNTTDSLEAISDKVTTISTAVVTTIPAKLTAGVPQTITVATVDGSATAWTQAAHRLFTVTGLVKVRIFGVVSETLTGAATLEVGVAGSTASLIAQLANAGNLVAGDIFAGTTTATAIPTSLEEGFVRVYSTDIDVLVGAADITNGAIDFYCEWLPISTGAAVVAAIWD